MYISVQKLLTNRLALWFVSLSICKIVITFTHYWKKAPYRLSVVNSLIKQTEGNTGVDSVTGEIHFTWKLPAVTTRPTAWLGDFCRIFMDREWRPERGMGAWTGVRTRNLLSIPSFVPATGPQRTLKIVTFRKAGTEQLPLDVTSVLLCLTLRCEHAQKMLFHTLLGTVCTSLSMPLENSKDELKAPLSFGQYSRVCQCPYRFWSPSFLGTVFTSLSMPLKNS